jgi:hypothetical protein
MRDHCCSRKEASLVGLVAVCLVGLAGAGCNGGGDTSLDCGLDEIACDGACVDLSSDDANCGQCGHACPDNHGCRDGICALDCPAGMQACDGVCVDPQTAFDHCGGCDRACAPGEVCSAGRCAMSCQPGMADCSGDCVDLQSDRTNCGACGDRKSVV